MFFNIKYIIQGYLHWFISLFKDIKNSKLYSMRLELCEKCDKNNNGICEICSCVLKAKTKSDSKCPLNKW